MSSLSTISSRPVCAAVTAQSIGAPFVLTEHAAGGSAKAAGALVHQLGGRILEFIFIIGLKFLKGHEQLNAPVYSMIEVEE